MTRAEYRRKNKEDEKRKTATYNLTKEQLDILVKDQIGHELEVLRDEVLEECTAQAMRLTLMLPLKVLKDFYWKKSYKQRLPEFADILLDFMYAWQNGSIDIDDIERELWDDAGIKFGFCEEEDYEEDE